MTKISDEEYEEGLSDDDFELEVVEALEGGKEKGGRKPMQLNHQHQQRREGLQVSRSRH